MTTLTDSGDVGFGSVVSVVFFLVRMEHGLVLQPAQEQLERSESGSAAGLL
jgi:hypothetical protein